MNTGGSSGITKIFHDTTEAEDSLMKKQNKVSFFFFSEVGVNSCISNGLARLCGILSCVQNLKKSTLSYQFHLPSVFLEAKAKTGNDQSI